MEKDTRKPGRQRSAIAEAFGRSVREAREAHGWSQPQLVDALARQGIRVNPSQVAKIELGQRAVNIEELLGIAEALKVPPARLLDYRSWTDEDRQWMHVEVQMSRLMHLRDERTRALAEVDEELERVSGMYRRLAREMEKRGVTGGEHPETD